MNKQFKYYNSTTYNIKKWKQFLIQQALLKPIVQIKHTWLDMKINYLWRFDTNQPTQKMLYL